MYQGTITSRPVRLTRTAALAIENEAIDYHDIPRVRFARYLYERGWFSDWLPTYSTPVADHVEAWLRKEQARTNYLAQFDGDNLPF